ncbi:aldo/keto reductase [Hydrogenophaga sp. BPS33]|uniref:aldo/keto reductase n=1 Tax=Hydrogenophaga sp. BPS33 TaxID=2651974 RepID=UPI00131FE131|nr:aldo/keto reductase [Hydrogenophaga sp. BPS33]QHE88929.1 aldo/keto reductase [Hydrogenophaga sp. BPS33]
MKYKTVGRTGLKVSSLCLGTMLFPNDPQASRAIFAKSLDAGINFFDCANSYGGGGKSEELLGDCIAEHRCRDEIVLISKVCRPMGAHVNNQGLSRWHILREAEASLKRLKTDRIDFYFAHHYDPLTPIDETLRAFDDLQRQGKILYPAVSNWSAWRIAKALGISARESLARFELIQPMYNLVKRQAEHELFPLAESEQMGAVVFSPLASGLLTGLYGVNRSPDQGRLLQARYAERYSDSANFEIADRFTAFAQERGVAPATLAVAWAMSHPAVTAPIIGPDNVEQLQGYLDAAALDMSPSLRDEITALAIPFEYGVERTVD